MQTAHQIMQTRSDQQNFADLLDAYTQTFKELETIVNGDKSAESLVKKQLVMSMMMSQCQQLGGLLKQLHLLSHNYQNSLGDCPTGTDYDGQGACYPC
jgi:hypothetical protein